MISSRFILAAATVLLGASTTFAEPIPSPVAKPAPAPVQALTPTTSPILAGCFSSASGFTFHDTNIYQTSGLCQTSCTSGGFLAIAINGTDCWCSNTLPPTSDKVPDSDCTTECPGFGSVTCGTTGSSQMYWNAWNAGVKNSVSNFGASSSSSTSATPAPTSSPPPSNAQTASPSVVTIGGQTVVVTASSTPTAKTSNNSSSSSGPNKAGIAAGVVVGVVAIAAIAGGVWFYIRARRRREVEEEFKRQAAISSMTASKPSSSGGYSVPDSRLDPAVRRMSDGSIADNQDFSRRILKVTNA